MRQIRIGTGVAIVALGAGLASAAPKPPLCAEQDRSLCVTNQARCLRDCPDLTTCSRRCREALQECLAQRGCAPPP